MTATSPLRFEPRDEVSTDEAAVMLGCSASAVQRHVAAGRLPAQVVDGEPRLLRMHVERLASEIFAWRRHADDAGAYWVTGQRAADTLGVSRSRLGQLADARQLPHVRHQDGTRLYRRRELTAIRDARGARSAD
jgi:excisionase family DNA binding protein